MLNIPCSISTQHMNETRVTRRVSHVEHDLLTRQEHLSSSPVFSGVGVALSFDFCVVFCRSVIVCFLLFLFVNVLSVLLPFTAFDYPLVFFKLLF